MVQAQGVAILGPALTEFENPLVSSGGVGLWDTGIARAHSVGARGQTAKLPQLGCVQGQDSLLFCVMCITREGERQRDVHTRENQLSNSLFLEGGLAGGKPEREIA